MENHAIFRLKLKTKLFLLNYPPGHATRHAMVFGDGTGVVTFDHMGSRATAALGVTGGRISVRGKASDLFLPYMPSFLNFDELTLE